VEKGVLAVDVPVDRGSRRRASGQLEDLNPKVSVICNWYMIVLAPKDNFQALPSFETMLNAMVSRK
jgi:hypothetical protein